MLSCVWLCNPMDCSLQVPLPMGFSRQEYWSGLPFSPPGDLPNKGMKCSVSHVSCIGRWVLYHKCHLGSRHGPMRGWVIHVFFSILSQFMRNWGSTICHPGGMFSSRGHACGSQHMLPGNVFIKGKQSKSLRSLSWVNKICCRCLFQRSLLPYPPPSTIVETHN